MQSFSKNKNGFTNTSLNRQWPAYREQHLKYANWVLSGFHHDSNIMLNIANDFQIG